MKQLFIFSVFFFVPLFSICQKTGEPSARPFLNLKWTPTSLVTPTTPTFLAGVEIWPAKKINFQYEYGHPVIARNQGNKANRYYRKHKFGIRYHYFPKLNKRNRRRLFNRRRLLPDTRRNFVGIDLVNFPQSYVDLNGSVTTPSSMTLFYSSALVYRNAVSSTVVFGSQIPLKKGFFIELYTGFGMKWMNVEHVLAGTAATPALAGSSGFDLSFFDNTDGKVTVPIIDAGIKIGFEMLHK